MGRRSNKLVHQLYGKGSIEQFVKSAKLEWAGNVWRAYHSIVKTVLVNNLNRKIPRGRPRQRWLDVVKRDHRSSKGPKWSIMLKKYIYMYIYITFTIGN